jgi:hypothetical protein
LGGTAAVSVTATATANTGDPDPSNNTASVTVRAVRPSLEIERLSDGRVALTWPSGLVGLGLQQGGSPQGPWAAVPGTVDETPLGRRLVLDGGATARMYRLGP